MFALDFITTYQTLIKMPSYNDAPATFSTNVENSNPFVERLPDIDSKCSGAIIRSA